MELGCPAFMRALLLVRGMVAGSCLGHSTLGWPVHIVPTGLVPRAIFGPLDVSVGLRTPRRAPTALKGVVGSGSPSVHHLIAKCIGQGPSLSTPHFPLWVLVSQAQHKLGHVLHHLVHPPQSVQVGDCRLDYKLLDHLDLWGRLPPCTLGVMTPKGFGTPIKT